MVDTGRKAETSRLQLAFTIDSNLTEPALRRAVEKAREKVDLKHRDRIEFSPPIKVKAPLPCFAFVAGEAGFAGMVVACLMERYKGGMTFDLREKIPVIARDPALSAHSFRVVARDGAEQIMTRRLAKSTLAAMLGGILGLPEARGGAGVWNQDVTGVVEGAATRRGRAVHVEVEAVAP